MTHRTNPADEAGAAAASPAVAEAARRTPAVPVGIVVFERAGRVQTASPEVRGLVGSDELVPGVSLDAGLSASPSLLRWIEGALERMDGTGSSHSGVVVGERGGTLSVHLTSLPAEGTTQAVVIALTRVPPAEVALPQNVARKTWHDIQNQLGGLKLYATFLKKKLGAADEQIRETAEKIVTGIDAVSQSITNARRGEEG